MLQNFSSAAVVIGAVKVNIVFLLYVFELAHENSVLLHILKLIIYRPIFQL